MSSLIYLRRRWRFVTFLLGTFTCLYLFFDVEAVIPGKHDLVEPPALWEETPPTPPIVEQEVLLQPTWKPQINGKIRIAPDSGIKRHPMYDLVADAERKWKAMVARQSKTVQQAVKEYQRRYGRLPPKGFDDWFRYSQSRGVMLIDEFDQIEHDILPYLATPPNIMNERIKKLATHGDSFHIEVKGGKLVPMALGDKEPDRALDMFELVQDFAHMLPDLVMHASLHDTGAHVMRDDLRSEAIRLVREGKLLTKANITYYENKKTIARDKVIKACADESPSVKESQGQKVFPPSNDTFEFIADHRATMDFCNNPELLRSHGSFIWDGARDSYLEPFFVSCRLAQGPELLMPALSGYADRSREQTSTSWDGRAPKAFWRGSTTGNHFTLKDWKRSHRIVLHFLANAEEGNVDILVEGEGNKGVGTKTFSQKELNERYMDIGLVGQPIQCDKKDGACEAMTKGIVFKPRVHGNAGALYKYAVDVDGNGWSQRYQRLLSSGSVVLKATIFPEWNTDWLLPYYHYLPLQMDYSDLYNTMAFFAGTPGGSPGHDDMAEKIAANAKRFTIENWRWEDMQSYMFRLLLEYARAASSDRDAMTYKPY